ncbi:hypothetical protein [Devosia sp.]|uniref:hypothetical protein n=1 Tax=Devosia sp. TaxID=1871048 RepID=UPI003A9570CF
MAGADETAQTVRMILGATLALVVLIVIAGYVRETFVAFSYEMSRDYGYKLWRLNGERTVAAWLSSMLMAGTGAAMLIVSLAERRRAIGTWPWWVALGLVFLAMSVDELIVLHETFTAMREQAALLGGFGTFSWVAGGIVFVAVVAIASVPFLLKLPRRTAGRLIVAGAVFVGGALGVEMVSAYIYSNISTGTLYDFTTLVEETLEFAGVWLGLRAVLEHFLALRAATPANQASAASQAS